MCKNTIGENIAALRKKKGITQDQLAKSVNVSAQAVSKWENGGMPDAELLPAIADVLGVSIDALFGRTVDTYTDIISALANSLDNMNNDQERFKAAFDICTGISEGLIGYETVDGDPLPPMTLQKAIEKYGVEFNDNDPLPRKVDTEDGFMMAALRHTPYFLLVPDVEDKQKAYLDGIDYISIFKDFSDKDFFNALVFLNKRENRKNFTANLLIKSLGFDAETAERVLSMLKKYNYVGTKRLEIDDEVHDSYFFIPRPEFVAMLLMTHELACSFPREYAGFRGPKNTPYLA